MRKLKLENNWNIQLDLNELPDKGFLEEFGNILKKHLKIEETELQIDVSKIWCNNATYEVFKKKQFNELYEKMRNKRSAQKMLGWTLLCYAPACDLDDNFKIPSDVFYLEDDCILEPREGY